MSFARSIIPALVAGLAAAQVTVKVDPSITYQQYDGTGVAEAFQRSLVLHQLNNYTQHKALDLLFSGERGAGLTILRNGLGSSPTESFDLMESISPMEPASNSSDLIFQALPRDDQYQVWLSKQAIARGVHTIYADAWSADGYMKTNGDENNNGFLCGVSNTSCASGDWRQSYANKIVKYIQDYQDQGIKIDLVGFLNEPDQNVTYASMGSSGQQAADFLTVLVPTLQAAGLDTKIACCDGSGWEQNRERLTGIQAAGAEDLLDVVTAHGYSSTPSTPYATTKRTWITEWSTFDAINYDWYNSSTGSFTQSFGLTWANHISNAFTQSNVTAFVYWWGAANATDNESLIFVNGTSDLAVTKRLWAISHFGSRFIRQNATRISAVPMFSNATVVSSGASLNTTAFLNTDGSVAVQIINNGDSAVNVTVDGGFADGAVVQTWLTNQEVDLRRGEDGVVAEVPARSLFSFVSAAAGTV